MAAQGKDSAEEAEAEGAEAEGAEAEGAEAEVQSSGEPLTAAVNWHGWPWGDGAEQDWRVSGQVSRRLLLDARARRGRLLYLRPRAFATAAPSDANSRQPPPGSDGEDIGDSEDCEEPRCAAAMLNIFRSIPTQMDYKGQKLAEQIFQGIILVSAIIGFIYGYMTEQFGWTVYIVVAGFLLSCLIIGGFHRGVGGTGVLVYPWTTEVILFSVCAFIVLLARSWGPLTKHDYELTLPPWPMYRRNPLQWLPVQESGAEEKKSADRKPKRHAKS